MRYGAIWLAAAALAVSACDIVDLSTTTPDMQVEVRVDDSYAPDTVFADRGAVVRWVNEGSVPHNYLGPYFSSGIRAPGQSFSLRLNHAGAVNYRCTVHPGEHAVLAVR